MRFFVLAALASLASAGLTPLIDYIIPVWPSISCSNPGFDPPLCPTQDGSACQVRMRERREREKSSHPWPPHCRSLTPPPARPHLPPALSQAPLPSKQMQDYISQVRARVAAVPNFFYFTAQCVKKWRGGPAPAARDATAFSFPHIHTRARAPTPPSFSGAATRSC